MDSDLYRTARKREFAALASQLFDRGLRPADIARLLKKTKASVSKYLSGKQNPPESTLMLLRHVVDQECGAVQPHKPDPDLVREEALAYGRRLALLDPENQRIVKELIDRLGPSREMIRLLEGKGEEAQSSPAPVRDSRTVPGDASSGSAK